MGPKELLVTVYVILVTWDVHQNYCQTVEPLGNISEQITSHCIELARKDTNGSQEEAFCPDGMDSYTVFLVCCCCCDCKGNETLALSGNNSSLQVNKPKKQGEQPKSFGQHMINLLPLFILLFSVSIGIGLYYLASRAIVPISSSIRA